MSTSGRRLLFESADVRAALVEADGAARPLVVTFDSLNHDLRPDRPGFGEGWLDRIGFDAVHVTASANDWYQHPEMADLCAAVRAYGEERPRVVTYGSSMGGYAAIRFAGRLGARAAVAISPQFSIDPARAPFDTRWLDHGRRLRFLWDEEVDAASLEAAYVFYDPRDLDRLHVEALAGRYPVRALPLRHAGHPAGAHLAESGLLGPAVTAMIEGRFDAAAFEAELRGARRRSGQYHFTLAHRQPAHRRRTALRLAEEAARLGPHAAPYVGLHGRLLAEAGEMVEAERLQRRAIELEPGYPRLRVDLAAFLSRQGRHPEALAQVADVERYEIDEAAVFARAVGVRFLGGDLDGALALAASGRARMPHALELKAWDGGLRLLSSTPGIGRPLLALLRRLTLAVPERTRARIAAWIRRRFAERGPALASRKRAG